jgi:hypothetical protein
MEFKDPKKKEDFLRNLNLDPILDDSFIEKEKDLKEDECEIELRKRYKLI